MSRDEKQADWIAVAAHARDQIERSSHGHKQSVMSRLAAGAGMGAALLRRAIAAYRFLEGLEQDGIAVPPELRRAPVGVIEIVSRWAEWDQAAAFAAGVAYVEGGLPFRELLKQEVAARPGSLKVRPARMIDVRRAWKEEVLARLSRIPAFASLALVDPRPDDPPIDAWVENKQSGRRVGGLILVGPCAQSDEYARDRETWVWKTMGIAREVKKVWLVVPTAEHARSYRNRLDRWVEDPEEIIVVPLTRPPSLSAFKGPRP